MHPFINHFISILAWKMDSYTTRYTDGSVGVNLCLFPPNREGVRIEENGHNFNSALMALEKACEKRMLNAE